MAKKAKQSIKEVTVSLAIKKAGGAYQFWRRLAEAVGALDFKLQYGDNGFVERAVSNKGTVGTWYGGQRAWSDKDNPRGAGYIGGKFVIGHDKKELVVSSSLVGK
jgi:hypothetical protein